MNTETPISLKRPLILAAVMFACWMFLKILAVIKPDGQTWINVAFTVLVVMIGCLVLLFIELIKMIRNS